MENKSRYLEIACDIVNKIVDGTYKEGTILRGRSILAAEYATSPETIRKAMNILAKEKIVVVRHGVGVFVDSKFAANEFKNKMGKQEDLIDKEKNVKKLLEEKKKIDEQLNDVVLSMISSYRFHTNESIKFSELVIAKSSWVIDHSIGDIYFWNYTEATIVAVSRNGKIYTSPGPDFVLLADDILILVGKDELSYDRALMYVTYGAGDAEDVEE